MLRISEIAALAGISVRTLRHYDQIGLVIASKRSVAGYRLYAQEDVERLQQVLFYRELGFGLKAIRALIEDPSASREEVLQAQQDLLCQRLTHIQAMIDAIDETLRLMKEGIRMEPEKLLSVFGKFNADQYEEEVKARWGDSDAYKEATRRTAAYSREDWRRIKMESATLLGRMLDAYDRGVSPTEEEALRIAEDARLRISRSFYDCSREMHAQLAESYVTDPRFRAHYDGVREGLAEWLAEAIRANARHHADD